MEAEAAAVVSSQDGRWSDGLARRWRAWEALDGGARGVGAQLESKAELLGGCWVLQSASTMDGEQLGDVATMDGEQKGDGSG
jgi:hypothetical protein